MKETAWLKKLKEINDALSKIESSLFVLIALLTLMLIIMSVASVYWSTDNPLAKGTKIEGFQTFEISNNGQGNIIVNRDELEIHVLPNSTSNVLLFASTRDFAWNFSGAAISAVGNSVPIAFSIEWGKSKVLVWADRINGWRYNYTNNDVWAPKGGASLNASLSLKSIYDFETSWHRMQEAAKVNIKMRNQTWNEELTIQISVPSSATISHSTVALQAWAGKESEASANYSKSVFVSYNMEKFTGHSGITTFVLASASTLLAFLTIIVLSKKATMFWSKILLFLNENKLLSIWKDLKKLTNGTETYIKENKNVFLILWVFAAIRFIFASAPIYHFFDTFTFKVWENVLRNEGLLAIYPISDIMPPLLIRPSYPYPPLIAYVILFLSQLLPMQSASNGFFIFLMKLPPILADLALGWVIFMVVKSWKGYRTGLIAMVLSLMNLVNSSVWAQFDSIVALFMVLSVLLVMTNRIKLGWLFAGLSLATKQIALPYLPGLLILTFKQKRWAGVISGIVTFTLISLLVWSPFLLGGYSLDFVLLQSAFGLWIQGGAYSVAAEMSQTTIYALNVWPIITWVKEGVPISAGLGGEISDVVPYQFFLMNYYQIGLLLFAIFYVAVLFNFRKTFSNEGLVMGFSLLMLAFYLFPTRMHERYMLFSIVFLPLAFEADSKFSISSYLVLLTTYSLGLGYGLSSQWVPFAVQSQSRLLPDVAVEFGLLSLILANIVVFVLLLYRYLGRQKLSANSSNAAHSELTQVRKCAKNHSHRGILCLNET